jgi:threonine/homoserine/homoserine lactone efflux protein
MAETIGAVLAFAVGVGISPVPIIAVVLMLFSDRARVNGPLFLLGWVVGLSVVVTATYLIADRLQVGDDATANSGASWVRLAMGTLLVVAAARKWRSRPGPDDEPSMPRWMTTIDRMAPVKAFGLALALSANPKNLVLALGAGVNVAQVDASSLQVVVGLGVFVLVGSAAVLAAVVYDLVGGARARASLDRAKGWLTVHNGAVMAVLFLVFGAVLLAEGLSGLR